MNIYQKDRLLFEVKVPVCFLLPPRKKEYGRDISGKTVVFWRTGLVAIRDDQLNYLCVQISEMLSEIPSLHNRTAGFIKSQMMAENCLVIASDLDLIFFTCLYDLGDVLLADSVLLKTGYDSVAKEKFQIFLAVKMAKEKKYIFTLLPKDEDQPMIARRNTFFVGAGFKKWQPPREEERQEFFKIINRQEGYAGWEDLLEEAYGIFIFDPA